MIIIVILMRFSIHMLRVVLVNVKNVEYWNVLTQLDPQNFFSVNF